MLLAGTAAVSYEGGGVVDATPRGDRASSGGALAVRHRYLAAEDTPVQRYGHLRYGSAGPPQGFYAVTESDARRLQRPGAALGDSGGCSRAADGLRRGL